MSESATAFAHISPQNAKDLFDNNAATFIDIRDPLSRSTAHIPASVHLDNTNATTFLHNANKAQPLVIYCYHGNSSQSAATFLVQNGFTTVYSMDGGFDLWHQLFPTCYQSDADATTAD